MASDKIDRRQLLKCSAAGVAAASALLSGCSQAREGEKSQAPVKQEAAATTPPPSERVTVGCIGVGGLGYGHHLKGCLLPNARVEVVAVCDVDRDRRDQAAALVLKEKNRRIPAYEDYRALLDRKDIDAVLIATPDHWHTLTAIAAIQAGKDVYCEKPLTLALNEGKAMVAAARRYGTVFQVGSQQRSNDTFRRACELVRNGKLGKLQRIDTVLHQVHQGPWVPAQTPPPNLNWNMWLGQAPYRDYLPNCVHYQFRWIYDYSGGVMTDWGAHHNDIAQWGMGMDHSGPVEVDGTDAEFNHDGPYDVAMQFNVRYKYANGVDLVCHTNGRNGITFTGSEGTLFVARGNVLECSNPDILKVELGPNDVHLYDSHNHHENWLNCIASRERCICDVEIGHRSVSVCHIGNISMRLGRPLKWDPLKEEFVGDAEANAMLGRPMRAPWHLA